MAWFSASPNRPQPGYIPSCTPSQGPVPTAPLLGERSTKIAAATFTAQPLLEVLPETEPCLSSRLPRAEYGPQAFPTFSTPPQTDPGLTPSLSPRPVARS